MFLISKVSLKPMTRLSRSSATVKWEPKVISSDKCGFPIWGQTLAWPLWMNDLRGIHSGRSAWGGGAGWGGAVGRAAGVNTGHDLIIMKSSVSILTGGSQTFFLFFKSQSALCAARRRFNKPNEKQQGLGSTRALRHSETIQKFFHLKTF